MCCNHFKTGKSVIQNVLIQVSCEALLKQCVTCITHKSNYKYYFVIKSVIYHDVTSLQ